MSAANDTLDHVRILPSIDAAGAFAADPDVISGKVNLGIVQETQSTELQTCLQQVSDTLEANVTWRSKRPQLFVPLSFFYRDVEAAELPADAIAEQIRAHGVAMNVDELRPLSVDIFRQARAFIATWPLEAKEKNRETHERGLQYFVRGGLHVTGYNRRGMMHPFFQGHMHPKPELAAMVHYAGRGMHWWPNQAVDHAADIDWNQPDKAVILNEDAAQDLKPGQTAYFATGRTHGLAMTFGTPIDKSERPSIFLSLRRHSQLSS